VEILYGTAFEGSLEQQRYVISHRNRTYDNWDKDAASIEKGEREAETLLQENKISVAEKEEENAKSALTEAQKALERAIFNREIAAQQVEKACKYSLVLILELTRPWLTVA
jgi:hypothetical protein